MKKLIIIACLLQASLFAFGQKLRYDTTFVQGIYLVNEKGYNDSSLVITKKINKADISDLVLEHKSRLEASTRDMYATFDYSKRVSTDLDALEAKDKALKRIADTSLLSVNIELFGAELIGNYSLVEFGTASDFSITLTEGVLQWAKGASKGKVKIFSKDLICLDSYKKKEMLVLYQTSENIWCNADGIFKLTKK